MKKIQKIDTFLLIGFMLLLVGYNDILTILTTLSIVILICLMEEEKLLPTFILLHFFEERFAITNFFGLTFVVISPIILIRLLVIYKRKKCNIPKEKLWIIIFFICYFLISIFSMKIMPSDFAIYIDIAILILFSSILSTHKEKNKILESIFSTVIISTLFAILYGIVHLKIIADYRGNKVFYRFCGSYEPNYMAMYINLAIVSLVGLKNTILEKYSKIWYYAILIILGVALLATMSTTGLIVFTCLMLVYLIRKTNNKLLTIAIILLACIIIFTICCYWAEKLMDSNNPLIEKIGMIAYKIKTGNIYSATSGRIPIYHTFVHEALNRDLANVLIGCGPNSYKLYDSYFRGEKYVHSVYLDLLYSFGILGMLLVLGYIINNLKKNSFLGESLHRSKYNDTMINFKIVLLISALALSMHAEIIFELPFIL